MKKTMYANVIIDISHEKLDKTFQYKIPEHLTDQIRPGVQVEIPFGKWDSLRKGYVIEVTDVPDFDPEKTKEIHGAVSKGIPMEAQMIVLAAWMRQNFGGTMNQSLKTVLPVKEKTAQKQKRMISLNVDPARGRELFAQFTDKHQTARARLLEALLEQSPLPYETVTGKLNITATVIRALEERKLICVTSSRSYRNPLDRMKKQEKSVTLNELQQNIANDIVRRWKEHDTKPSLIRGVTGSGKTEVYIEIIRNVVENGRQAIVLIPEIALTYQTVLRFYNHFGDRVSILNSRMSAGERFDQFERAKNGMIDVMIGPRSALFTPFERLGCIIIDEEHETSYKSETVPKYHARETAIARASMHGAFVVLGSATPSIESYDRAKRGIYQLYEMTDRVQQRPLPTVYTVDLREELQKGNRSILSDKLRELMIDRLQKQEQIMLFLNRRGISGFVSCRSCGHVIKCPHCDVSLSLHNYGKLQCHYCGFTTQMVKKCPSCGSGYIGGFKAGTQKIETYIKEQFPNARVLRMDLDTTRNKDSYEQILSAFANQEADILIGTQMIVKGHDFPNVTLVGILAADLSLHVSDYRAAERTFQLLTQAAGRAGRGKRPGEVVIQTYQPDHYSIQKAEKQDYEGFYEQEIAFRSLMHYPPAWNMLLLHISSENEILVNQASDMIKSNLAVLTEGLELSVIGPADPAVSKVKDIYRKVIYVKGASYKDLVRMKNQLEQWTAAEASFDKVTVQYDFNPQ